MICVGDFEVFKKCWLCVFVELDTGKEINIVNDSNKLREFYKSHKNDIFVFFNGRNYDKYIFKAILCGYDPYKVSQFIIEDGRKGWEFDKTFQQIQLFDYDAYTPFFGLKTLEGFMGDTIKETSVPFDIDRDLTEEEVEESLFYCRNDVLETIKVLRLRKNEFDAQFGLIKTFDLHLSNISKTQAQLAAVILGAVKQDLNDEWDIRLPETVDLGKYKHIGDWFLSDDCKKDNAKLECEIGGIPHVVGLGGLHGAIERYNEGCSDDEIYVMNDVNQMYPTLMVEYNLLSRGVVEPFKFVHILNESLRLKALGEKNKREPFKRICNISYGAEGDKFNPMYDPLHRNLVCVFGQVLLIDLIDKIESFCKLIQSNTDGILVKVKKKDLPKLNEEVEKWQKRTKLVMSYDEFVRVIQRDVNNYIIVPEGELYDKKGKPRWKAKGAVVKELSTLDYDLPIVNEAVKMWFLKGTPPEKTVFDCDELIKFQKIFKVSSLYKDARLGCTFREESIIDSTGKRKKVKLWNEDGELLTDKTFRVFASKKETGALYKRKEGKNPEKFASCPENCFIENESVVGKNTNEYKELDKQWYVDLARKRIREFV